MCKTAKRSFIETALIVSVWIFKVIPESVLVFFSGIFVSFAINILTGPITSSTEKLSCNTLLSVIFMLLAALTLIIWACIVKPYQDDFRHESQVNRKRVGGWKDVLTQNAKHKYLIVCTLLIIFVLFWVFLILGIVFFII